MPLATVLALSRLPPKQVARGQLHQEETHEEINPAAASTVDRMKESVIAATVHCIALDDSGDFPANRELGLFEVASPDINDLKATPASAERLRVSKAQIEFSAQRQQENGRDSPLVGAFNVTMFLQVAVEEGGREQGLWSELTTPAVQNRESIPMSSGAVAVSSEHESPIFLTDWQEVGPAVAAAAAASVTDRAEAQAAISAIACWNILATAGKVDVSTVTVELAAVFGNGGNLYVTNQDIDLKRSGTLQAAHSPFLASSLSTFLATENTNDHPDQHQPPVLGGTLEWRLQDGIRDKLDEIAVADVKVYTKAPATSTDTSILYHSENSAPPSLPPPPPQRQLLLHGTLCKRASGGFGQTDPREKEPAPAFLQAVLMPYAEQRPYARRSVTSPAVRDGSVPTAELVPPDHELRNGASTATSSTTSVVSEMEDWEWWKELEDHERGMEAVHALPRDPDWKPGRWRILRERRRKQREERERRRMMETDRRREETHATHGHSTASRGEDGCGGIVGSVARQIWRAMKKQWNSFRR